jgi:hypothetical protein
MRHRQGLCNDTISSMWSVDGHDESRRSYVKRCTSRWGALLTDYLSKPIFMAMTTAWVLFATRSLSSKFVT